MLVWSNSQRKQIFWQVQLVRKDDDSHTHDKENVRSYENAMATRLGECWAGWTNIERGWLVRLRKAMAASSFLSESGGEVKPPLLPRKRGEHQLISGNKPTNQPNHHTASRLLPYYRSILNHLPNFKPIHLQSRAADLWNTLRKSMAWSMLISAVKNWWGPAPSCFSFSMCAGLHWENGGCCES